MVANQPVLLSVVFDYKSKTLRLYEDGELTASTTNWQTVGLSSDTDSVAVTVGAAAQNKYGFDGDIYSVAMYRRVMSNAQRWEVEAALATEFGLSVVQE